MLGSVKIMKFDVLISILVLLKYLEVDCLTLTLGEHFPMQTLSPCYGVTRHGGLCFADITYLPLKVVEGAAQVKMILYMRNAGSRSSFQNFNPNCLECSLLLDVYAFVLGHRGRSGHVV